MALRPDPEQMKPEQAARERLVRQAILQPGTVESLPRAKGAPVPVPLWVYPSPFKVFGVEAEDDLDDTGNGGQAEQEVEGSRKQAERFDDSKQTDGLMVFKLEALFTWAESVDLDRPQEENLDEDLEGAAEDLDIITLSKKRRAGSSNIKFDLDLPAPQNDDLPLGDGMKLPEWDYRKQIMLDDYCLLQPMLNDDAMPEPIPEELRAQATDFAPPFQPVAAADKTWQRKQPYGDEIDMDAWLEHLTQIQNTRQSPRHQNFYKHRNDPAARAGLSVAVRPVDCRPKRAWVTVNDDRG